MKPYYEDGAVTIYHGDCREVLPTLEAERSILVTDPDYGVGMQYADSERMTAAEADNLLGTTLILAEKICADNGLMFWSGSWARVSALQQSVWPWHIKHLGIWYKPNGAGASGNGLARRFEPWFWICKGDGKKEGEWQRLPDCISINRVHRGMDEASAHPCQKPEELMRRLIRFFSLEGQTILDPFMGSGTTLRAAKDIGRRAIGIEVSEKYAELAANRMAQAVLPFAAATQEEKEGA